MEKNAKNVPFFYKERNRMQKTFRSFINNGKERKKRLNRRTNTWRHGCFGKMDDYPDDTTPNSEPPKVEVLPETFHHIILPAKWLYCIVPDSSSSPA